MLSKIVKASFSSKGFSLANAVNTVKSTLNAPIKHIKRNIEPSGSNYSRMTNTTEEAFDEVAHEWQALVTSNPFDLNVFNYLENTQTSNFGTVDNPLVIFTSETPFRYVGCTGQMNEDDYEGHELLYFLLREGSLQRCMGCGQVFKLVRLRNEYSPEMDYYLSNFHPYEMQEMGESDTTVLMSPTKYASHYEYTQFETPSNMVYSMVNPDEHDRLLVDPAYRMERTKALEEKYKVYTSSLREVEKQFEERYGRAGQINISKVTYSTLIDVEKAVLKMDRLFRKVAKFENRAFIDRTNHSRREKRMLERAQQRWDSNYSFFTGSLTEEEQKYRDYYETELEAYPEDEGIEQQLDQQEILLSGRYNTSLYDFQEGYTKNPEDDQTSLIEKKAFKFRYRLANETSESFQRRNNRMVERQIKRFAQPQYKHAFEKLQSNIAISSNSGNALHSEYGYLELLSNEAVQLYKDYYQSDAEEDFKVFENLSSKEKLVMIANFENNLLPKYDRSEVHLIPKRQWEPAFGVWENFLYDITEYASFIAPRGKEIAADYQIQSAIPLTQEELIEAGLYKETIEKKEEPKLEAKKQTKSE
ncbi:hypothetical protein ABPG72_013721 [Tetrahymena utriculariae]